MCVLITSLLFLEISEDDLNSNLRKKNDFKNKCIFDNCLSSFL